MGVDERPIELVEALRAAEGVSRPPPGAMERVRRRIQHPRPGPQVRPRTWVVSVVGFCVSAAAAASVAEVTTGGDWRAVLSPAHSGPTVTTTLATRTTSDGRASSELPHDDGIGQAKDRMGGRGPRDGGREGGMPDETLGREVAAYQYAMGLRERDPAMALQAFRAMQQKWPNGDLAPEVQLRIVELLVELGREEQSRQAAREFVERHPNNPKVEKMRVLGGGGQPASR